VVLLAWAAHKDSNPLALYAAMLHVIPPIGFYIPMVGINQFFQLNNYRILSLVVLLPLAVRILPRAAAAASRARMVMDACLVGFILLQLVAAGAVRVVHQHAAARLPADAGRRASSTTRSAAHASRARHPRGDGSLCLACAVFAAIAVFETAKGWLLYRGARRRLGAPIEFAFLMRGDSLRSQVVAGPLAACSATCSRSASLSCCTSRRPCARARWRDRARRLALARLAGRLFARAVAGGGDRFLPSSRCSPRGVRFREVRFLGRRGRAGCCCRPGAAGHAALPFVGTVDLETVEYRRRWPRCRGSSSSRTRARQPVRAHADGGAAPGPGHHRPRQQLRVDRAAVRPCGLAALHGSLAGALWTDVVACSAAAIAEDPTSRAWAPASSACLLGTLLMLAVASFVRGSRG
jgi:hypothetical protein